MANSSAYIPYNAGGHLLKLTPLICPTRCILDQGGGFTFITTGKGVHVFCIFIFTLVLPIFPIYNKYEYSFSNIIIRIIITIV